MASELRVTTIANNAGTESVDTAYVINGSAKSWVQLIGTGTVSTLDSFNSSSISDLSLGRYQTNFSNSMNNDDYAVTASDTFQTAGYYGSTTSSHNIFCNGAVSTPVDSTVSAIVHGDIA